MVLIILKIGFLLRFQEISDWLNLTMSKVNIDKMENELECLNQLKTRIKENPKFDKFQLIFNDNFLLHFVRGKKYNPEIAYNTLENYINLRKEKHNAFFKSLRPSLMKTVLDEDCHLHVFKCQQNKESNQLIIYDRVSEWDPKKVSTEEALKKGILIFEEAWNQPGVEINGFVVIFDVANMTLNQVPPLCNVTLWQKSVDIFWKSCPLRVKGVHVVNNNFLINQIKKIVNPLLPQKIRERLHFHGHDMSSLHKFISPDILPQSLGGLLTDEEAFQDVEFYQKLREKDEYYRRFIEKL